MTVSSEVIDHRRDDNARDTSIFGGKTSDFDGVPTYDGKFMEYTVVGQSFQVLPKYTPPFNPIGKGSYGFVW